MLYGSHLRNETLLTNDYLNVLDREPDPAGYAYWLDRMAGGLSSAEVLASFSESAENQSNVSAELDAGLWLA